MEAVRGDYDGDEINLHFPQSPATECEVWDLMGIHKQIVTAQSSRPVVKLIHDSVVAMFWLTNVDKQNMPRTFDKSTWQQIACQSHLSFAEILARKSRNEDVFLQYAIANCNLQNMQMLSTGAPALWTLSGWALLSLFLPEHLSCCITGGTQLALYRDVNKRHRSEKLIIHRGIVVNGTLDSRSLSGKNGLLHTIFRYYGATVGCQFISNVQSISAYLTMIRYNCSVGVDDCITPLYLKKTVDTKIDTAINRGVNLCHTFGGVVYAFLQTPSVLDVLLDVKRGHEREILQSMVLQRGIDAHDTTTCNQIALLTLLGTKGSISNIMQTVFCLGQQVIDGGVLSDSWMHRVFAHEVRSGEWSCDAHKKKSLYTHSTEQSNLPFVSTENIQYKGFIRSAFVNGLSPVEYWCHAMAGREALVEGATSTAASGYAMRLGVKLMEHDITRFDSTVRDLHNNIVQFQYGGDGIDQKCVMHVAKHGKQIFDLDVIVSDIATLIEENHL